MSMFGQPDPTDRAQPRVADLSSVRARLRRRGRLRRPVPPPPSGPAEEGDPSGWPNPLVRASDGGTAGPIPGPASPSGWTGLASLVLVAAGVTLLALFGLDLWRERGEQRRSSHVSRAVSTIADGPTASTTTAAAPAPAAERVWPAEPPPAAPAPVVTFEGARYAVGAGGDVVETGDWSCTGTPTAAVLRPSTGEVLGFDRWPAHGEDAVARPLGRAEGATRLRVSDRDGDGCDDLDAVSGDGRLVPVELSALVPPR